MLLHIGLLGTENGVVFAVLEVIKTEAPRADIAEINGDELNAFTMCAVGIGIWPAASHYTPTLVVKGGSQMGIACWGN